MEEWRPGLKRFIVVPMPRKVTMMFFASIHDLIKAEDRDGTWNLSQCAQGEQLPLQHTACTVFIHCTIYRVGCSFPWRSWQDLATA